MNPSVQIGSRTSRIWQAALLCGLLLWPAAPLCGAQAGAPATQLVWPPPPDQPRIAYVKSISNLADAGMKESLFRRVSNWLSGSKQSEESLVHPFGVALDEANDFCFADTGANTVSYFNGAAKHWYRWTEIGDIAFSSPVAVAKSANTIYVADSGLGAIIAFDLNGKLLFRLTEGLMRPSGIAIFRGHLLVTDAGAHCVQIVDLHGKFLSRFGARGADPGFFNFPTHVAVDSHGNIYVTDSMNSRVEVFDGNGKFERQIGGPGDAPGTFSRPKGVAVDAGGRVYVVDALFGNVQIFDSTGQLLMDFGRTGSGPGEFSLPAGIAIGQDNLIYVADAYNGRVQVFKYVGGAQ
jgi:DNA-binding beta-propeller fold protein YncE